LQTSSDDQYGGGRLYYNRDNNRDRFKSRQSYQPIPNNDYVKLESSADQQSTIDYLKAQIHDLKAERRKDEAQIDVIKAERRKDEAEIDDIKAEIRIDEAQIDYLKAQIDDLKAERRKDEAQIKKLEAQLNQGKLLNKKIYFLFINKVDLVF
jgi:SMC interacting uncharacterized protein involved in chromosome segregation